MVVEIIAVFFMLGCHLVRVSSSLEGNSETDVKFVGESSFFTPKIWTEYSKLLYVHEDDSFCRQNPYLVFSDRTSKDLYYRCRNEKKELYQCIEGFEFDDLKSRCLPKSLMPDKNRFSDCKDQMNGFYPDYSTNCQEYYRCENGVKVGTWKCPAEQSFSFHRQSCQIKRETTCTISNCHVDNDDFFIYPDSRCQAYYFCKNGLRTDFLCPRGSTFDIKTKMCVENGVCYEPVCAGRIDGTYADTTHECTRSFKCKGGMLEEVNSCPGGMKHNGSKCVSSDLHTCEKPEKTAAVFYFRADDECKHLRDGSHLISGTDCRQVRVCSRGKTSAAFECTRDERYDGNWCLPKDLVPCDDLCSMKPDGEYPDVFAHCQSYYSCSNEKVLKRKQCPKGTAFNGYFCAPSELVSCPKIASSYTGRCLGLRDGFHPDYLNNCRKYFYCYNHEMVLTGSCEEGWIYNGKECIEDDGVTCEGPQDLKECSGLPPGLYKNKSSDCSKYYYCNNGVGTKLTCTEGQVFNGYKCVSRDQHTCTENPDECDGQPEGYIQDKNTACRSYHFCSNGNKITYVCPDKMVFNGSSCVSQFAYDCPFSPSKDCIDKSDGYHPDEKSTCQDYYYCLKGEKLNTLTCGGKKIFNGKGCILVNDPVSACAGYLSNPCRKKKDGSYADTKTNCRRYYSCRRGNLINDNWCPKGYGFDGTTCRSNFFCSFVNDCVGKRIGFYQNLSSQCRTYYFCFLNTKTIGVCPIGTIFNGHLCIDSNYYKCPTGKT